MIRKKIILIAVLFAHVCVANAQLSVDVFYGYNHSGNEHSLPEQYDGIADKLYFTNEIDTIYLHGSNFYYIRRYVRQHDYRQDTTKHDFTSQHTCGIALNYRFVNYFRVGLSFEKIGIGQNWQCVEAIKTEEHFDNDNQLFYYSTTTEKISYNVIAASLQFSFLYPYKDFVFSADCGLKAYSSMLSSERNINAQSWYHPMLNTKNSVTIKSNLYQYHGYNLGYTVGAGISYQIGKNYSAFVNAGYTWASMNFQKEKTSESYITYDYQLGEAHNYKDVFAQPLEPAQVMLGEINYNSLNIRLGISYVFGKK
ncbi:MAG TPA: hypothetical protein PLZ52_08175 [Bacteroidales bacterium]|nr:hypothetical protein [Bacteroidales bacterium]